MDGLGLGIGLGRWLKWDGSETTLGWVGIQFAKVRVSVVGVWGCSAGVYGLLG